jgi:hypothetical protein
MRQQVFVLRRVNPVMTTREHGDSAAGQTSAVRCLIDAARQSRCDDETRVAEIAGNCARKFQTSP